MRTRLLFLALLMFASNASAQKCVNHVENCFRGSTKVGTDACFSNPKALNLSPNGARCAPDLSHQIVTEQCRGTNAQNEEVACCHCKELDEALTCVPAKISPNIVEFYIQSPLGITSITVLKDRNADLFPPKPYTPAGTREPIIITATKIDRDTWSRVELFVCDQVQCAFCDPVVTLVTREAGKPVRESFSQLPQAEGLVTIYNESPGLKTLQVTANGRKFMMAGLKDGEERTLDISAAMLPGEQNIITLTGLGKPGGSATVMIHD